MTSIFLDERSLAIVHRCYRNIFWLPVTEETERRIALDNVVSR